MTNADVVYNNVLKYGKCLLALSQDARVVKNKQNMVNMLFTLKDRLLFYERKQDPEEGLTDPLTLGLKIIDFLFSHKLRPCAKLQEEYLEDESLTALQLPSFETLNELISMDESTYARVLERYTSKFKVYEFYYLTTLGSIL